MPIYTVKEFAELTGKKPKDIHTYATRGKVIKTSDARIDTTNEINNLFFELNKVDTTIQKTTRSKASKTVGKKEAEKVVVVKENVRSDRLTKLEIQKKQLEVDKLKRLNEIAEEDLKLRRGETVDLKETLQLISNYSDGFKKDLAEQFKLHIQEICSRHGITTEKAGEYSMKVNDIINASSKKSISSLNDLNK